MIAATLPYVAFSFGNGLDPKKPRYHVGDLAAQSMRAYGAHLNGLETLPWFAAAVIVAHMVGISSRTADILAVGYVVALIVHVAGYVGGRQPLRSAAFGVGQLVAIFVSP